MSEILRFESVYRISATEALIIKPFLKELSFELNILSNQTGQVKVEIDELVAQKENVYKFTLQNIEGTRATKTQSFSSTKNSRKCTKMHENACKIIGNEELK